MVNSYRKKPVVIQAEQYIAERDRLPFSDEGDPVEYDEDEHRPYILSLEGKHWVSDGDWIIRGVKGEFYACKPDIFALTYEAADLRPEEAKRPYCPADVVIDANRYRALRDSGIAVAAWQDMGGVHWAVNGTEYTNLDDGADALIKMRSPQEQIPSSQEGK